MPATVTHESAANGGVVLLFHRVSNMLKALICDKSYVHDTETRKWQQVGLVMDGKVK